MPKKVMVSEYNDSRLWTDLLKIAERHNIEVWQRDLRNLQGFYYRGERHDYAVLSTRLLPGEREKALASMLGTYQLHRDNLDTMLDALNEAASGNYREGSKEKDAQAERFAGLLLRLLSSRYKGGSGGAITGYQHPCGQEAA